MPKIYNIEAEGPQTSQNLHMITLENQMLLGVRLCQLLIKRFSYSHLLLNIQVGLFLLKKAVVAAAS